MISMSYNSHISLFIWHLEGSIENYVHCSEIGKYFWIRIFVFGKRWMYNHMLCYWLFTCAVECYFPDMYLHLYVPWNLVRLIWLNSWQRLLTSRIDWTWNILHLCTQIRSAKVLYFSLHAFLNMFIIFVGSLFGSLAWLCVEFVQD